MTRRRASLVAFRAGPRTSGSAAYSSKRSCIASKTLRDSSPWRQALRALVLGRLVQRRAQQGHLGEVVEVPGLQRGVLPVVGEAQELAGLGLEVAVALQFDERPDRQDRGGRASVVDAERRQLGALGALALGVGDAAGGLEAEQEVPADQRRRHALPFGDDPALRHRRRAAPARSRSRIGADALRRLAAWFPS